MPRNIDPATRASQSDKALHETPYSPPTRLRAIYERNHEIPAIETAVGSRIAAAICAVVAIAAWVNYVSRYCQPPQIPPQSMLDEDEDMLKRIPAWKRGGGAFALAVW